MSSKWTTSHGVHGLNVMQNVLSVDEIFCAYNDEAPSAVTSPNKSLTDVVFPQWFVKESFVEYKKWQSGRWIRSSTRGSGPYRLSSTGLDIDLDTTPLVCAAACASIGLPIALLPGDRIDVKRSAGRLLELQEEAVVLGAHQGRLWYRLVSQKSEGGSLMEGGGRAWFWDESEAVEGGLLLIGEGKGRAVELPMISRFKPTCGLKIVYVSGAVGTWRLSNLLCSTQTSCSYRHCFSKTQSDPTLKYLMDLPTLEPSLMAPSSLNLMSLSEGSTLAVWFVI